MQNTYRKQQYSYLTNTNQEQKAFKVAKQTLRRSIIRDQVEDNILIQFARKM